MRAVKAAAAALLASTFGLTRPAASTAPPAPEMVTSRIPIGPAEGSRPTISFVVVGEGVQLFSVRLDGVDVTALVRRDGGAHRIEPPADLAGGEHVVLAELSTPGDRRSERWTFTTPLPPPQPVSSLGYSLQGEVDRLHAEPVSGEGATQNDTIGTIAPHIEGSVTNGSAHASAEWNATWAQSYDVQNKPTHLSPPAVALRGRTTHVSAALGNGPVETFAPSLLLQTMTTRRGIELGVDAPVGALRVYGNIDDGLPSASGVSEYRQNLYGASITPALGDRLKTRFIFQYAEDARDPLYRVPPSSVPSFGDAAAPGTATPQPVFFGSAPKKGVLEALALEWLLPGSANVVAKADVARSDYTPDNLSTTLSSDWAWAFSLAAAPAGWSVAVGIRDVGDAFGSPANPALMAGRRSLDATLSRAFGLLYLSASYARTMDSGRSPGAGGGYTPPSASGDNFMASASLNLPSTRTAISLAAQLNKNASAGMEARQTNVSVNIGQSVGTWQVSLGLTGGTQSIDGPAPAETRLGGATVGVMKSGPLFSIQASGGVNRSENVETGETMTGWNAFATPDVALFDRVLSITPFAAYSRQTTSSGLSDSDSLSWGGRLTLRTWGSLKGFALFGQYLESRTDVKAAGVPGMRDRRFTAGLALLLGGGSLGPTMTLPQVNAPLR